MKGYYENTVFDSQEVLINVIDAVHVKRGNATHPHWHEHMEILTVEEGIAFQQIDNCFELIRKGDVVVIGCNQLHSTYPYENRDSFIKVYQLKIIPNLTNDSNGKVIKSLLSGGLEIGLPVRKNTKELFSLLTRMSGLKLHLYDRKDSVEFIRQHCVQKSLINEFITSIVLHHEFKISEMKPYLSIRAKISLNKFFLFLDENFMYDINLIDAAKASNYSKAQFTRLIRAATGCSFNAYLNKTRIEAAIGMILEGRGITESALMSGFGNISSFNRQFKKFKGVSPRQYLKREIRASK